MPLPSLLLDLVRASRMRRRVKSGCLDCDAKRAASPTVLVLPPRASRVVMQRNSLPIEQVDEALCPMLRRISISRCWRRPSLRDSASCAPRRRPRAQRGWLASVHSTKWTTTCHREAAASLRTICHRRDCRRPCRRSKLLPRQMRRRRSTRAPARLAQSLRSRALVLASNHRKYLVLHLSTSISTGVLGVRELFVSSFCRLVALERLTRMWVAMSFLGGGKGRSARAPHTAPHRHLHQFTVAIRLFMGT